jgi:anaerobic selenocysteine-containing dehydrogenase
MKASPLGRPSRIVNMSQLGHALTELQGPAVKALFVYNSNPAAVAPNHNAVKRGLQRSDLFTVVHEQFFTDTTDYADVVLPATTFLEHKDFQGAYGHYYWQFSEQAITPLGEAKSNVWMFRMLAQRMGFTEACFRDDEDALMAQALGDRAAELKDKKRIREGCGDRPFQDGKFSTPSGKIEFYAAGLAAQGLEPLPTFRAPEESRRGAKAREFPLEFLPRKADNFMNSTFANLPGHQKLESPGLVMLHAADAEARQIQSGDWVEVFNGRGKIRLQALVDGSVAAGVVAASLNWNKLSPDGNNVNALTSEQLTDLGRGATFYSTLVEVRKLCREEAQNGFPPID